MREKSPCALCPEKAAWACIIYTRDKNGVWYARDVFACSEHENKLHSISSIRRTAILPVGEFFARKAEEELDGR